jgi:chemotaxis regulatin CheY-phosphate phosphatase CheZ
MTIKRSKRKSAQTKTIRSKKQVGRSETTILSSETAPELASAIELLLAGLANGDGERVQSGIRSLLDSPKSSSLPTDLIQFLNLFHTSVWALRQDFCSENRDVGAVTLPEVSENLARLRTRAEEATKRTISLIEQQEQLVAHSERLVSDLETLIKSDAFDHDTLERELLEWKVLTAAMRRLAVDMLCTQDFEDLCGFILPKVQNFIKGLEGDIRGVLARLHVELPQLEGQANKNASTQADVDALLKQHGR